MSLLDKIDKLITFISSFDDNDKDIELDLKTDDDIKDDDIGLTFYRSKHIKFIMKLQEDNESEFSYEYCQTEHLRMQVLYWALCCLDILKSLNKIINNKILKQKLISFVLSCWIEFDDGNKGGFGGNIGHDIHLLNTLSAIQILILLNEDKIINGDKRIQIINYISSLQNKQTGSFQGDKWGEIDTRFTYAALNALSLLNGLNSINITSCCNYLMLCRNFDGGYGTSPGAESHSGMIFCCCASLAIINKYNNIDVNVLNWWLCERQIHGTGTSNPNHDGGLNGRPMKLPDVCYSWWCLSAMKICNKVSWINKNNLIKFILNSQDNINGGISDRPDDLCDIYHTFFGIGGLSLLGCTQKYNLKEIDPIWALPRDKCRKIGLYQRHKYADINYDHDII